MEKLEILSESGVTLIRKFNQRISAAFDKAGILARSLVVCGFCKVPAFSLQIEFENKERSESGMGICDIERLFPILLSPEISGSVSHNFKSLKVYIKFSILLGCF